MATYQLSNIRQILLNHPIQTTFVSITALLIPPIVLRLRADYHAYLAAGRGGLPYNIFGWALQWTLRLTIARKDTTDTSIYSHPPATDQYGELGQRSFLSSPLPPRRGARPTILPFIAPHRQEEGNSTEVRTLERAEFDAIAEANGELLVVRRSRLEQHEDALWLAPSLEAEMPAWARATNRGEVGHVHLAVDGSAHVTLSISDARQVLEMGWGERHALSGRIMPWGYVLLYAPRDEVEVEVLGRVFRAGVGFMSGGKEVS